MKLYHYTSLRHLEKILNDGTLQTTASNLLKPVCPHIENGQLVDVTDSYKPVVWFTSVLDFEKARYCGLTGSVLDKTEVAIEVTPTALQRFYKWTEWAEQNNIDKAWYENLKSTAPLWDSFYVIEAPVGIRQAKIIYRPDIYNMLTKKG